jgi:outer membrane immunogenic protein
MRKILFAALILGAAPAYAQDGDEAEAQIGGARIEVRAGIERPNLSDTQGGTEYVASLGTGLVYGGEIGYDIPVSKNVTVGPYIGIDGGGADKCESYVPAGGGNGTVCFKGKSNVSGGIRVAYVSPKTELYLGLGYSSYSTDFTIQERNTANVLVFNYASTGARGGLDVALGANFNVSKRAYVGIGMKIGQFGEFEGSGFNLQRAQVHAAVGMRF